MSRYAVLNSDKVVVNIIVWSGDENEWRPEPGYTTVNVDNDRFVQIGHRLVNGVFVWQPSQEQIEQRWYIVRQSRNELLKLSDNLVLPDRWEQYDTVKKEAISSYRQQLRDLTINFSDPFKIVWPTLAE